MAAAVVRGRGEAGGDGGKQEAFLASSMTSSSRRGDNKTTTPPQDYLCFERFSLVDDGRAVQFVYSFNDDTFFYSSLRLLGTDDDDEGHHTTLPPTILDLSQYEEALSPTLLDIGLCVLPWYWMGFAVPKVVVRAGHLSPSQVWTVMEDGDEGDRLSSSISGSSRWGW